ncbi:hypothetical protein [Aliamphritea spongicola]|nr:hypothetical protein [Aliamphritea spongicola]
MDLELITGKAFYLIYPDDLQLTYGMRVFRDWLLEVMGLANPTGE